MAIKKKVSWLLVGDGAQAQLYSINAQPLRIKKVTSGGFRATRKTHSQVTGSTKVSKAGGSPRHTIERHTSAHQRHEDAFVGRVAAALDAAAGGGKFDDIIVVLPPRALAHFRKVVAAETQRKIRQEIQSEWTKLRTPEIEQHLARRLP